MTTRTRRIDSLPEGAIYRDEGCAEVSDSCLTCPLKLCIYDDPAFLAQTNRAYRDDRIFTLRKKGVPVRDIARAVNKSTRTIHRVIRRGGASEVDHREIAEHLKGIIALRSHLPNTIYRNPAPLPPILGGDR